MEVLILIIIIRSERERFDFYHYLSIGNEIEDDLDVQIRERPHIRYLLQRNLSVVAEIYLKFLK